MEEKLVIRLGRREAELLRNAINQGLEAIASGVNDPDTPGYFPTTQDHVWWKTDCYKKRANEMNTLISIAKQLNDFVNRTTSKEKNKNE